MNRPVLLIEIGAGPLPAITPVSRPRGSWVPVVYQAPLIDPPAEVTPTPVTDGVLLQWAPVPGVGVVYIIDRSAAAEGPWLEIARTPATRYLYSDGTNAVWFFRIRASINGRIGSGSVVRAQLDLTTEKIRQEFLKAVARDQELALQLLEQAQDLANLQAMVEAPEWVDQAWPAGSIVKHDGGLYVARQDVPEGTVVTDTAYWSHIGQYASLAEAVGAIGVAMQQVTTDVQQIEQELQIVAQDVSGVRSSLAGKADSTVVQAMNTRLTQAENSVTSLSQLIGTVQSALAGKADANALQVLQSQVSQQGKVIEANSTAITRVSASTNPAANLLYNASFQSGSMEGWVTDRSNGGNFFATGFPGSTWGPQCIWTGNATGGVMVLRSQQPVQVVPGVSYVASADVLNFNNGRYWIDIRWANAAGQDVGYSQAKPTTGAQDFDAADERRFTTFGVGIAPANATQAQIRVVFELNGATALGARRLKLERGSIPTPYNDQGSLAQNAVATQSLSTRVTRTENGVNSYEASSTLALDVNGRVVGTRSVNNGVTGTIDFVFDKVRFLSPNSGGARAELTNGNYFVWAPNGVRVIAQGWSI